MADNSAPQLPKTYKVGKSAQYRTLSFSAALEEPPAVLLKRFAAPSLEKARPEVPEAEEEEDRPKDKRAVWIVHGMGQQVPFETVDSLAQGLLGSAKLMHGHLPRVTEVKFLTPGAAMKEQLTQRIELDVVAASDPGNESKTYQLHLYEAYWAPVTEGVAKVSDVVSFLFDGGMRGMLNSKKPFFRAMFPGERVGAHGTIVPGNRNPPAIETFHTSWRTPVYIGAVLLVLLALTWTNTVTLAAGAAAAKLSGFSELTVQRHWPQITAIASAMCAVAVTFGVLLFIGVLTKPAKRSARQKAGIAFFAWLGVCITAVVVVVSGLLMTILFSNWLAPCVAAVLRHSHPRSVQGAATGLILLAALLAAIALAYRAAIRSKGEKIHDRGLYVWLFYIALLIHLFSAPLLILVCFRPVVLPSCLPHFLLWFALILSNPHWVWPFLIFFSSQVRTIMVQFPGDVAIYVASQKLDRFDKVRKDIKQIAFDSLSAIYTAVSEDQTSPVYSKIAVVGHSLGSVIAYDTLNKLLNLDDLCGNAVGVAERTCLLETFGSPLDKIAFFFCIQGQGFYHFREQLASVVQPLIQNYEKFRKIPWINVYSRNDIISGSLDFYDLRGLRKSPAVRNFRDKDAVVPLVAHVDYWKNKRIWRMLYDRVAP